MGMKWRDSFKNGSFFKDNKELVEKIGISRIILIVLAGVVLVLASVWEGKDKSDNEYVNDYSGEVQKSAVSDEDMALSAMSTYADREERKLEKLLERVEGIGDVKVMITLASSEERMTLQNTDNTESNMIEQDSSGGSRQQDEYSYKNENVIISKEGEETPYVVQVNSPEIEGVVVVAKGAGSGKKDTEIIEAVVALFSIEPHKIKVMKME